MSKTPLWEVRKPLGVSRKTPYDEERAIWGEWRAPWHIRRSLRGKWKAIGEWSKATWGKWEATWDEQKGI